MKRDLVIVVLGLVIGVLSCFAFFKREERVDNIPFYEAKIDSLEDLIARNKIKKDSLTLLLIKSDSIISALEAEEGTLIIKHEKEIDILNSFSPIEHIEFFSRYTDDSGEGGHTMDSVSREN